MNGLFEHYEYEFFSLEYKYEFFKVSKSSFCVAVPFSLLLVFLDCPNNMSDLTSACYASIDYLIFEVSDTSSITLFIKKSDTRQLLRMS